MLLMQIHPVKRALELMRRAEYAGAANLLRAEYDKNPARAELARIANLITPCGMIAEAIDALNRLSGSLDDYLANPPADEDIARTAPATLEEMDFEPEINRQSPQFAPVN